MKLATILALLVFLLPATSSALEYRGFTLEIRADEDVYRAKGNWEHHENVIIAMAGLHGVEGLRLQVMTELHGKKGPIVEKGQVFRVQRVGRDGGYFRIYAEDTPLPAAASGETLEETIREFLEKVKGRQGFYQRAADQEAN